MAIRVLHTQTSPVRGWWQWGGVFVNGKYTMLGDRHSCQSFTLYVPTHIERAHFVYRSIKLYHHMPICVMAISVPQSIGRAEQAQHTQHAYEPTQQSSVIKAAKRERKKDRQKPHIICNRKCNCIPPPCGA